MSRPHPRRVLAATVAAVAVGALVFGVDQLTGTAAGVLRNAAGSSSPRQATERALADLLAVAPVPPGARPSERSPVAALDDPSSAPGVPNLVTRTKWWTAPGTPDAVLHYVSGHLPGGLTEDGSARRVSSPQLHERSFAAGGHRWSKPTTYTDLGLLFTATSTGTGVAVRVDAQAIWLPQRTAAEHIPSTVTSVAVVTSRDGGAPRVRRLLGRAAARSLADVVNSLPTFLIPGSCPQRVGFIDTLTFHAPSSTVEVRATADCGPVTVLTAGRNAPELDDAHGLDQAVLRALDLPANCGQ